MSRIFGYAGAILLIVFAMSLEASLLFFVDLTAMLICVGLPIAAALAAFGLNGLLRTVALVLLGSKSNQILNLHDLYRLRFLRSLFRTGGSVGLLVAAIAFCFVGNDPAKVGPIVALILLGSLYALFFGELLVGSRCLLVDRQLGGGVDVQQPSARPALEPLFVLILIFIVVSAIAMATEMSAEPDRVGSLLERCLQYTPISEVTRCT